jgi:hypothetical protein
MPLRKSFADAINRVLLIPLLQRAEQQKIAAPRPIASRKPTFLAPRALSVFPTAAPNLNPNLNHNPNLFPRIKIKIKIRIKITRQTLGMEIFPLLFLLPAPTLDRYASHTR